MIAVLATVTVATPLPSSADGNEAPGTPLAARSISAGEDQSCALLDGGTVKCWGYNNRGQLGQDSTDNVGDGPGEMAALDPIDLGAGRTATAIAMGGYHACALLDDATVKCWGYNAWGQLGQDSTDNVGDGPGEMAALDPIDLGAGRTATAVTAGEHHSCALLDDGSVKCWGLAGNGQLGNDSTDIAGNQPGSMAALNPVNLGAGRTATAVSAGFYHTCALLDDATVKCWGANGSGQLGQDSTINLGDQSGEMAALVPVNLGAARTATAISAGGEETCAVLDDGTVKCWGENRWGQLGQNSTVNMGDGPGEMAALNPVDLGVGRTATAISSGPSSCALLDDSTVKCWGYNLWGQLGQGSTTNLGDQPGEMASLAVVDLGAGRTARAVTNGDLHSCALLDDGTVKCWGYNFRGQLGQGSTASLGDGPGEMTILAPVDLGGTVGGGPGSPTGLSGTVSESGSGSVVGGAWVAVLNTSDFSIEAGAVADGSGNFTASVPPGSYYLYVVDPSGAHSAGFFGPPSVVAVNAGEVTTVAPELVSLRGSVVGSVTDAVTNAGVAGAWAVAISAATGAAEGVATGDGSGEVVLDGLRTGNHFVAYVDPSGSHASRFWPDSTDVNRATPVTVAAGAAVDADAVLPAVTAAGTGAVIAGTLTDDGTGAPLVGARVVALRASDFAMARGAVADGSGHYELDLEPNVGYRLAVIDADGTHAMEWFDGQPNTGLAASTVVTAPGVADAALASSVGAMAGTVTDEGSGDPLEGAWVVAIGPQGIAGGAVTAADGTYTISGLAPGTYRITFVDPNGGLAQEYYDDSPDYPGATPFAITAGTTASIDAALALP